MIRAWGVFLDAHPLVLTPFLMRPYPCNYDAQGLAQAKGLFDSAVYSYGINYLALPAGVVPIDLVEDLPAGVQIVGRRFREDTSLDAMEAVEQRRAAGRSPLGKKLISGTRGASGGRSRTSAPGARGTIPRSRAAARAVLRRA
jgi:Asp-tRNA(Asn)/Glu-tRNA(Gln) amidotransferase A subunit family amidase